MTATRGPGRLSAEETARLQGRILDAAEAVFIETGYADATMDAVARRAEVTRKTVYARYANKQDLLAAVVERLRQDTLGAAEPLPASAGEPPRAVLTRLAVALAASAQTSRAAGIGRILYAETHRSAALQAVLADLQARSVELVRRHLLALRAQGRLPLMPDPGLAALLFIELAISIPRARAMLGNAPPAGEQAALTSAAVDLFLRGCGGTS